MRFNYDSYLLQLKTETRLEELLAEGDFPGAISIILECQQAALTYRHFKCVVVLAGKLQDTLVMTEEQLDVALASVSNFRNTTEKPNYKIVRKFCTYFFFLPN